jgi:SHS2 domain-containing protein
MSESRSFEFVDAVTSDIRFVARGATLDAVFRAAAEALLAATVDNPEAVARRVQRAVVFEEPDLELLLLRFLNELVYLRDAEGLLLQAARVEVAADAGRARVMAQLAGEPLRRGRHLPASDVKAVTAHGLRVARAPAGWEATVTLDV